MRTPLPPIRNRELLAAIDSIPLHTSLVRRERQNRLVIQTAGVMSKPNASANYRRGILSDKNHFKWE
jgi:hypothetical protein